MTHLNEQYEAARKTVEIAVGSVLEMATELAANARPRRDFASAMSAMAFFTKLPKGQQYADHFAIVEMLVEKKAIDVELFEFALTGTGFIKN